MQIHCILCWARVPKFCPHYTACFSKLIRGRQTLNSGKFSRLVITCFVSLKSGLRSFSRRQGNYFSNRPVNEKCRLSYWNRESSYFWSNRDGMENYLTVWLGDVSKDSLYEKKAVSKNRPALSCALHYGKFLCRNWVLAITDNDVYFKIIIWTHLETGPLKTSTPFVPVFISAGKFHAERVAITG